MPNAPRPATAHGHASLQPHKSCVHFHHAAACHRTFQRTLHSRAVCFWHFAFTQAYALPSQMHIFLCPSSIAGQLGRAQKKYLLLLSPCSPDGCEGL